MPEYNEQSMKSETAYEKEKAPQHICLLYRNYNEKIKLLTDYFKEELSSRKLCLLVTSEKPKKIIESFKGYGLDISPAINQGDFRILGVKETYLPKGKFFADYMIHNIHEFIEDAKKLGYSGLSTAGDMSWVYEDDRYYHEASIYESRVTQLTVPGKNFRGVCMYPFNKKLIEPLEDTLKNHPYLIYEGSEIPLSC